MRDARWVLAAAIAASSWGATYAAAGDGLTPHVENLPWARWQGRVSVAAQTPLWRSEFSGAETSGLQVRSLTLMGDYYFSRSLVGRPDAGGFRATSGVILGPRTQLWAGQPTSAQQGLMFSVDRRVFGQAPLPVTNETPAETATLPYLGLGYTGLSPKGHWSFSADLGMVALHPGNAVKFGRVFSGTQSLDELVREMRLAPMLQLGVSYSF